MLLNCGIGEDSWESLGLNARRSNQSILKEIGPEYSLEGLMLKFQVLWLPDIKNWFIGKDPDVGRDWRREEKGMTEDEMVGWHHWLDGHDFEQALGAGDGQGNLACCSLWGHKELDMTEWLNWSVKWDNVYVVWHLVYITHKFLIWLVLIPREDRRVVEVTT